MYLKKLKYEDDEELPQTTEGKIDLKEIKERANAMRQKNKQDRGGR